MIKYFITKDFIGHPTGIIQGEYVNGFRVGSFHHILPGKLSARIPGFDSLEEILNYKMCKCGKEDCLVNKELSNIVKNMLE